MTWPGLPGLHSKGKVRRIEVKLEGIGKCSLGKASRNRRKNKSGVCWELGRGWAHHCLQADSVPGTVLSFAYIFSCCIPTTLLGRSSLLLFCEEQAQMFSPIADV